MQIGLVYLIHLDRPLAHAQHYIGWTSQTFQKRLEQHRRGQGARFLQAAVEQGIKLLPVRVWAGTRRFERLLKNRKYARRLCPLCNEPKDVLNPKNTEENYASDKTEFVSRSALESKNNVDQIADGGGRRRSPPVSQYPQSGKSRQSFSKAG